MQELKNFTVYTPENPPVAWATHLISEDGHDWYECQKLFSEETYKIAYDSDNIIRSISGDVSSLFPVNLSVAEVETLPEGCDISGRWKYDNGGIVDT
ncbi:TPA: tail fiber assembly protein, partial [Escherichia coli]|nr:tail fiber assembly protein [Escherichia coli]HEL8087789.1 tail fiber assembly protein [Escherichia coli]HEL8092723.1 tail fiber assembly protein [Escherichia coli]HEM0082668.1 tail fiber assembly protein [Escherichia coli]HEM1519794.1 tail fiber assembly protein [Escherichia coli]